MRIGLPVPSLDYKPLLYHCNALFSFYATLILAFSLHYLDIFRLPSLIEHFGSLMSWAIIISFTFTLLIYFLAVNFHFGGKPMRMSGNLIYDIFMGASLNPRLFKSRVFGLGRKRWEGVDLKMFAEVRVPWVLLFMTAISGGVKQYEEFGYITPVSYTSTGTSSKTTEKTSWQNMAFMILAVGLYMNAW